MVVVVVMMMMMVLEYERCPVGICDQWDRGDSSDGNLFVAT